MFFLVAGAAAGGFVNGLAGFGTGLFALGWWLQVLPPVQAIAFSVFMSVLTSLQGVWIVRRDIRIRALAWFLLPALLGIPIGFHTLQFVDAGALKIVVAGFLLLYGGFFLFRRDLPEWRGDRPGVDVSVGFLSGILGSMAGLSGALPTMWLAVQKLTKGQSRAILQPFNMAVLGISALVFALDGAYSRETLPDIAIILPVSFIAARFGIFIFRRLTDTQFRKLLIAMMFLAGIIIPLRELF